MADQPTAVRVEFVWSDGEVFGYADGPSKRVFISKHYTGPRPAHQEKWWCRIIHDSQPQNPRKGVFFVIPIRKCGSPNERPPVLTHGRKPGKTHKTGVVWQDGERKDRNTPKKQSMHLPVRPGAQKKARQQPVLKKTPGAISPASPATPATATVPAQKQETHFAVELARLPDDTEAVKVTSTFYLDGVKVTSGEKLVTEFSQNPLYWPSATRREVKRLLVEILERKRLAERAAREAIAQRAAEARRQLEEEQRRVRAEELAAKRALEEAARAASLERQGLINALEHPLSVTVESIETLETTLQLRRTAAVNSVYRLYLGDELLGIWDHSNDISVNSFPLRVEGRTITLSDKRSFTVYSYHIKVFKTENADRRRVLYTTEHKLDYVNKKKVTWGEVAALQVGDALAVEHRFQWQGDWLTNGEWWFPRQRPEGAAAWRDLPVSAIPAELYGDYLIGLEGKLLVELGVYHARASKRSQEPKVPRLTAEQKRIYAACTRQMWKGDGSDQVSLFDNGNVVFHVRADLHILDNPGKGALYWFRNREQAMEVASGAIARSEALHLYPRIFHVDGWEERVRELLSDPAKLEALFAEFPQEEPAVGE